MEFPTGGKLVAGLGFAAVAFVGAYIYYAGLNNDTPASIRNLIGASTIGFICGWSVMGKKIGYGGFDSLASALRTLVILFVALAMTNAFLFILRGMVNGSYFDPIATVTLYFRQTFQYLIDFMQPTLLISTAFGALITGRLAGLANLYWR